LCGRRRASSNTSRFTHAACSTRSPHAANSTCSANATRLTCASNSAYTTYSTYTAYTTNATYAAYTTYRPNGRRIMIATIIATMIIKVIVPVNANGHYRKCHKIRGIISIIIWWYIGNIGQGIHILNNRYSFNNYRRSCRNIFYYWFLALISRVGGHTWRTLCIG
jgi:hypothetical protein